MEASLPARQIAHRLRCSLFSWRYVSRWSYQCWRCEAPYSTVGIISERANHILPITSSPNIKWEFLWIYHLTYTWNQPWRSLSVPVCVHRYMHGKGMQWKIAVPELHYNLNTIQNINVLLAHVLNVRWNPICASSAPGAPFSPRLCKRGAERPILTKPVCMK